MYDLLDGIRVLEVSLLAPDQLGMYRILGLAPGATYAVMTEVPAGYNDCAPNDAMVGVPVTGSPFILSGLLQPTAVVRCESSSRAASFCRRRRTCCSMPLNSCRRAPSSSTFSGALRRITATAVTRRHCITASGIRFESILAAGFSMQIVRRRDLTDPEVTYILHELGEETRHSRLFIRLLDQLRPSARNPIEPVMRILQRAVLPRLLNLLAFFCVLVLTGEEVPDLIQKLVGEHPDTDPFIRDVNRYHRAEEARHLAFARMILPGQWKDAGSVERFLVRRFAPLMVGGMFEMLVHPGVYETVGLPGWKTWPSR